MNNQITINVTGISGVGKSTIAFLIADFLSHTGFDVAVNLLDEIDEDLIMDHFEEKLEAIALKNTKIIVNEVQLTRNSG
ncbi:adenylyl-sulfate kinase [Candidatus Dojkabacteria bacterium]|jgi:nucleoside-triphosphatase THEP1|nr:adenylyl-sulfate kinase [Candidatus Dojkabacteria bacterium]